MAVCLLAALVGVATAKTEDTSKGPYEGRVSWVAGGQLIAFASQGRTWTVHADGSGRRNIGYAFGASVSPSGRLIGYAGDTGTFGVLEIGPAGGKINRRFRLWAGRPAEGYAPPVWSPDERRVLVEITLTGPTLLYRVDLHGRPHRISRVRSGDDMSPSWSPDGRRVAFLNCIANYGWLCDVAVMRPDGSARRALVRRIADVPSEPVWSPDGTLLAYTAKFGPVRQIAPRRQGNPVGVYVVRADGSGLRRVAQTRLVDIDSPVPSPPAWSPDGRRLAFADQLGISVVEIATRKRRRLTWKGADYAFGSFAWSPGPRVVFGHGGWIYTVSEGERPKRIARYSGQVD